MKTKLEKMVIISQLELDWMFIRALRKRSENYFNKGGNFFSGKYMRTYNKLQNHSNHAMVLSHRYKLLSARKTNSGADQLEMLPVMRKN